MANIMNYDKEILSTLLALCEENPTATGEFSSHMCRLKNVLFYKLNKAETPTINIDGLVRDCSISIAKAMEILQSCTKPLIYWRLHPPVV